MATAVATFANISSGDSSVVQFSWPIKTADPDGQPFEFAEWADITWVATGTWGGATLKVQGSADNSTWVTTGLSNAAGGSEASATANKVFTTLERPRYIRPILTTVGVGADLVVTALCRRANPMRT